MQMIGHSESMLPLQGRISKLHYLIKYFKFQNLDDRTKKLCPLDEFVLNR